MAKDPKNRDEAGVSGKTRNPKEFLQPETQFAETSANESAVQALGKKYPSVSLPSQGILSRFMTLRHLALVIVAATGLGIYAGVQNELDNRENPPSADLVELAERATTKFSPNAERHARNEAYFQRFPELREQQAAAFGHQKTFADGEDVDEFCESVEDFVKDKYIGKDKIADIKCTAEKLTITTKDGTVVTATPDGKETITGPGAKLSSNFKAVVDEAVRKHTQADDIYAETGFSAPFFTGATKDKICQEIIDEVNEHFAQRIVRNSCEPYRMSFTSDTREVVVATAQDGIHVRSNKDAPKKPGS